MKRLSALLIGLALVAAGCGDDENDEPDQPAQTTTQQTEPAEPTTTETQPAEPAPAESSPEDEKAVEDVVKTWLLEGGCERMTYKFLEDQLIWLGDNRKQRCDLFEKQFTKPQYTEDQIKISDVQVTGTKASLVVGSEGVNIESKYTLVKTGEQWQIDSADIQ